MSGEDGVKLADAVILIQDRFKIVVQYQHKSDPTQMVLRISRLIADLRKLAELETRSLERTRVDVAQLLEQAVALAADQPKASERAVTLTLPQAYKSTSVLVSEL